MSDFEKAFIEVFNLTNAVRLLGIYLAGLIGYCLYDTTKVSRERRNGIQLYVDVSKNMKVHPPKYAKKTINK